MKLLRVLRSNRGGILPDTAISFILFALLFAICISALGAFILKNELDNAATQVCRFIEVDGHYDDAEQQKISDYLSEIHLNAKVSVSPAASTYDLGDEFTVTLSLSTNIGYGGHMLSLPITGRAAGSSEVYQK